MSQNPSGKSETIKEYIRQVGLGIRNFHFFRISTFPRLARAFSVFEKKLLFAALAALAVCGSFLISQEYYNATKTVPAFGGKYSEGLVGQPRFLNPVLASANYVDMDVSRVVYSGLLQFDAEQRLVPDLASEMPQLSADQKQYTVRLRTDAVWHDGEPFTADDVMFTVRLIQNPAYQSPVRLNWSRVELQKLDDHTIVFELKDPLSPFIVNLTQAILPKHLWEGVQPKNFVLSKYNLQPIGTGPFAVKDLESSEEGEIRAITLKAFDRYYAGRAYLDEIQFKFYSSYDELIAAYHSKDILGLGYIPFDKKVYVEKSSRINQYYLNLPQYQALFFNRSKSPVLADKNVRAALAESINREEIIREVYLGFAKASFGPIPPGYLGYNPAIEQAHQYNIENAKKILDEAGFKPVEGSPTLQKGAVPLEFTITTNNFPLNVRTAEILKRQWEAVGFKINVQDLTIGELEQNYLRPREYQALLFTENVGADSDIYAFWHSSQRSDPGLNLAMFGGKETDQLIAEARANADPAYRDSRYQRLQTLLADDIPAIFIANSLFVYGVNTKVQGIGAKNIVSQSERFLDIENWYINTKRVKK